MQELYDTDDADVGRSIPLLRRLKQFMVLAKQVIHATQTPEMAEKARKAAVKVVVSMEAAQPKV